MALKYLHMALTGQVDVPVAATGIVVDRLKGSVLAALIVSDTRVLSLLIATSLRQKWKYLSKDLVVGDVTSLPCKKP